MVQMFEGGGCNKPYSLAFEPALSKQNRLRIYVNQLNENMRKDYLRVSKSSHHSTCTNQPLIIIRKSNCRPKFNHVIE